MLLTSMLAAGELPMPRCVLLLASLLWVTAGSAQTIVICRGDTLGASSDKLRADVVAYAQRVAEALEALGAPYRLAGDSDLPAALAGARLAILPYNKLTDEQVGHLAEFCAGGGRVLAFFTTGSEELPKLLGVTRGALAQAGYDGELDAIWFTAEARARYAGLPPAISQRSWHTFALTPAAGTRVIGQWGQGPDATRPAITENAAGWYVGHVMMPGDLRAKGQFLVSLAAALDPSLWQPVLAGARQEAVDAVGRVQAGWQQLARRADLDAARRGVLAEAVFSLSVRAGAMPPPLPNDGAATALLAIYRAVAEEAQGLVHQLAVSRPHELRGIWVWGQRIDWLKLLPAARAAGVNAIFYRVSRGGNAIYPSDLMPQDGWAVGTDPVAEAIELCRRYKMEFHAWRVCYHLGSAPASYLAQLRAEGRISLDVNGKEAPFANPADPRNEALELAAMRELCERYDLDGVHLDYIRYTETPHFDFDYSPVSRTEFEAARGERVADWPADVIDGELRRDYDLWQRSNIDRLVEKAGRMLRAEWPRVCFSAAVWRNHRRHIQTIKQDWPAWLDAGWIDLLIPMSYERTADRVAELTAAQVACAAGGTRVAAGLGSWLLSNPTDAVDQIEAARAAGADGWVLFSNQAAELTDQLAVIARGVGATAVRPATQTPPARWALPAARRRKDQPTAALAGFPTPLSARFGPGCGTLAGPFTGISGRIVMLQPATGEVLGEVGRFVGLGEARAEFTGDFRPAVGRFQLVAEAIVSPADGPPVEVVIRGPLVEGLESEAMTALVAADQPPQPTGSGLAVGVWHEGVGCEPILVALQAAPGIEAMRLASLDPEFLQPLAALVLPQLVDLDELSPARISALRKWVHGGGRLLVTHDAVGVRWHPRLFPALARGVRLSRNRTVIIEQALGDWLPGSSFEHVASDHVVLTVGDGATVVAKNSDGQPVVAVGQMGRGEFIACGLLLGATGSADVMPAAEVRLLVGLLTRPR